jgi:hypothetical protein
MIEVPSKSNDEKQAHLAEVIHLLREVQCLAEKGTDKYGVYSWKTLGSKGLFADVNRKYQRMKTVVWDHDVPPKASLNIESVKDTCLDGALYFILLLMMLAQEERDRFLTSEKRPEERGDRSLTSEKKR